MDRLLSSILLSLLLAPCIALRAEEDPAKAIREKGPVSYVEDILNDPVLGQFTDAQVRLKLLEQIGQWGGVPFDRISVKSHRPSAFHEVRCILALGKDKGLLVSSAHAVNGGKLQPFDFRFVEFPVNCDTVVKLSYPLLPVYTADKKYIEDVKAAIEQTIAAKNNRAYVDLMASLADRARGLPPFILARVDGIMQECGFDRRALNTYEHRPGATYLGSRSLTDELFASAFLVDTLTVPGVVVATTYLHEGKPVIISTFANYGSSILMYLPDAAPKAPSPNPAAE